MLILGMNLAGVIFFVLMVCMASARRSKRMLYGDVITGFGNIFTELSPQQHSSSYEAIYYTVAMKPAWGRVVHSMEFNDQQTSWVSQNDDSAAAKRTEALNSPRNNRCGGSFLTPRIVQTACHCVAHFYGKEANEKVVWEEPLVIYATLGYSRLGLPWGTGIYSPRRYYAHKDCRQWTSLTTRIISSDFALISLAKGNWGMDDAPDALPPVFGNAIRTAPLYTSQDLEKHYLNILRNQAICLFLGHGYSTLSSSSGLMSNHRPRELDVVKDNGLPRHTWRAITGYQFCHDFVRSVLNLTDIIRDPWVNGKEPPPIVWAGPDVEMKENTSTDFSAKRESRYRIDATWTCSMNAGKFHAIPVAGDGGYPVTCNNVYFAVQGIGWTKGNMMDRMSLQSAIVFARYENAADYREHLLLKMDEWYKNVYSQPTKKLRNFQFEGQSSLESSPLNSARKAPNVPTFLLLVALPACSSSLIKTTF